MGGLSSVPDPSTASDSLARVQSELQNLQHQLDEQAHLATLGTLVSMIAHEFNNVLTPVITYSQMALAAPDDENLTTKALERSLLGAERAAQIASAILAFARSGPTLELGRSTWNTPESNMVAVQTVEIRTAAQDALLLLGRDLSQDAIRLNLDVAPGLHVRMAPIALQHTLLNLILNARRAMVPRGGSLLISAREANPADASGKLRALGGNLRDRVSTHFVTTRTLTPDASKSATSSEADRRHRIMQIMHWIRIDIRDSGCGMDPAQLERLFTPFAAAQSPQSAPQAISPRTGLGMSMCRRLVDAAGGWMTVESASGAGTCVSLWVPMHPN